MAVSIKSAREIELMRESGRILSIVHTELAKMIKPGISTLDIDKRCYEVIRDFGCIPSFLNYQGYPASVCVSVNDEVVHGIPNKNRILKDGDIVSLDAGVMLHFSLVVVRVGRSVEQACNHKSSADGAADLAEPAHTSAEGGGEEGSRSFVKARQVAKGEKNCLSAVISRIE